MTVTTSENHCEGCGAILGADAIEGFCQRCLATAAFTDFAGDGLLDGATIAEELPRLGPFELLGELGRGGMGVVYRARQSGLGREIALKVLRLGPLSSAEDRARFQREAASAAALRHPNIVAVHEVGEADGHAFLAMELVAGRTLADLTRDGPLAPEEAARHARAIAEAITAAHAKGILHRDLKPSNVLVDDDGQPRVTDFGLAKSITGCESEVQISAGDQTPSEQGCGTADLTVTGQIFGSPGYMPPEQADPRRGGAGFASDVYSLGALFYHLLTGRPPFAAATVTATLAQVLHEEPVSPRRLNSAVPPDLETICLKCLAKEPVRRYASTAALADDLRAYLEHRPIAARSVSLAEQVALWCRRKPALAGLSFALALALALGLGGIVWQARQIEREAATSRLHTYAADMGAASLALQQGDRSRAEALLDAHQPRGGETDLRGFEWRLLASMTTRRDAWALGFHSNIVARVAFSPDSHRLASASHDGSVRLWDVAGRRLLREFHTQQRSLWWTAFAPDGHTLASGTDDGHIVLTESDSGRPAGEFPGVTAAWVNDGRWLVTIGSKPVYWDEEGFVEVWDITTRQRLRRLPIHAKAMALAPDGRTLALTRQDGGVQLWNVLTGEPLRSEPTDGQVWAPVFSPSGRWLAAVGRERVFVWEVALPGPPRVLEGHHLKVWSAAFSPDERHLFSTGSDRSVRTWDTSTWRPVSVRWGHTDEVWCVAASPDGAWLATGAKDGSACLWPAASAAVPPPLPHGAFTRPVFSGDGALLATAPVEAGITNTALWQTGTRALVVCIPDTLPLGFDGTGRLAVWRQRAWTLEWWHAGEGQRAEEIRIDVRGEPGVPTQMALSEGAAFGVAVGTNGLATLFDPRTGRRLGELTAPTPFWRSVAVSPRGGRVALSREEEPSAWLLDFPAHALRELRGHRPMVSGVGFSADGTTLATGGADGRIRLWRAATGELLTELPGHLEDATDVAFSADGRTFASLGFQDCVKLWHLATSREVAAFPLPAASSQISFSPDGRHLAVTLGGLVNEGVELFTAPALTELAPWSGKPPAP